MTHKLANHMKKMSQIIGLSVITLLASACENTATPGLNAEAATSASQHIGSASYERDRKAILAMAGDYKVTFNFTETVSHQPGYELKKPKLSGAYEVVRVIADAPGYISLQHILVVDTENMKMPVKHWRQDWSYEPASIMSFIGGNAWEKRNIPEDKRAGAWSQTVYQVDDALRYSGVGIWDHSGETSSWESAPAWRPLPRRDATTRDDYHAVKAANRHALTPTGWVHEQDNAKLILSGDAPVLLAREVGVNTYNACACFDISIATDYWANTKDYWAGVRGIWSGLEAGNYLGLTMAGEPEALYRPLLAIAEEVASGELTVTEGVAEARAAIAENTETTATPLQVRLVRGLDTAETANSAR